jgi:hypothetical protein
LNSYYFDPKYNNNCVFSLKKANIVDFCHLNSSTIGTLNNTSIQIYDTLLHPKRQNTFKLNVGNQPTCISAINQTKIAVMRKNEALIYDLRMERL